MRSERNSRPLFLLALVVVAALALLVLSNARVQAKAAQAKNTDARLQKAWRFERGGWTYVHLEGTPAEIGYQHGWLLAPEIADAFQAVKLLDTHNTNRDWAFFRAT